MTAIHRLSSVKALPEFDIFTVPPTQSTIEQDLLTEHRPISTLDPRACIEFNFSSGIDEYLRLDKSLFFMKLRITIEKPLNAEVKMVDWGKVSTVNNLLNSLFKQIDLTIGDRIINPPHQTYSYKTDIELKLGKSREAKETFLNSSFWFEKQETNPETPNSEINGLIKPESTSDLTKSKEIDLLGKIHLAMFEQPKALLGGCNIRIKFIPNDPSFYLMMPTDVRLKTIEFTDASLYVHRSKIARPILDAHLRALEIANAKYQLRESFVVPVTINQGVMDQYIDNIHNGQLPKRAFVVFVEHAAFNGSYLHNPYNYQNFGLCHLAFYLNGVQYPEKPFTPDFSNGLYVREYFSLFEATNQDTIDSCITIKRKDFTNGNNIFAVNFNPDLSSGCCAIGHVNPLKFGSLRLQVRFKNPLEKTITALVYLDYDCLLEINKDRNAFFQFN